MALHMDCFGLTDQGLQRKSNQDQFLIGDLRKSLEVFQTSLNIDDHTRLFGGSQGKLMAVADGMGGHVAGERASTIAVDSLADYLLNAMQWFYQLEQDGEEDFIENLKTALEKGQESINVEEEVISERYGMGTTLTFAYVIWPRLYVVHAGDSRCYLIRDNNLWQITKDHTLAQKAIDAGVLPRESAEASSLSSTLWNSLGGNDEVRPEAYRADLMAGDILLLCTDGLTKHCSEDLILRIIQEATSAESACTKLIDAANYGGGSDNSTAIVARFREANETLEAELLEGVQQDIAQESQAASDQFTEAKIASDVESTPGA